MFVFYYWITGSYPIFITFQNAGNNNIHSKLGFVSSLKIILRGKTLDIQIFQVTAVKQKVKCLGGLRRAVSWLFEFSYLRLLFFKLVQASLFYSVLFWNCFLCSFFKALYLNQRVYESTLAWSEKGRGSINIPSCSGVEQKVQIIAWAYHDHVSQWTTYQGTCSYILLLVSQ